MRDSTETRTRSAADSEETEEITMRMTTTQIFLARYLMSAGAAISLAPTVRSASRPSGEIHPGRTDRGFGRMRSVYVMRCWGLISAATLRLAPPLPPPIGLPAIQLVAVGNFSNRRLTPVLTLKQETRGAANPHPFRPPAQMFTQRPIEGLGGILVYRFVP
jgi:hypothetical protein